MNMWRWQIALLPETTCVHCTLMQQTLREISSMAWACGLGATGRIPYLTKRRLARMVTPRAPRTCLKCLHCLGFGQLKSSDPALSLDQRRCLHVINLSSVGDNKRLRVHCIDERSGQVDRPSTHMRHLLLSSAMATGQGKEKTREVERLGQDRVCLTRGLPIVGEQSV